LEYFAEDIKESLEPVKEDEIKIRDPRTSLRITKNREKEMEIVGNMTQITKIIEGDDVAFKLKFWGLGQKFEYQIKFSKIETDSVTILANNIKTETKSGAVGGGTTFGPGVKEVTSSNLRQAVKDAVGGKIGTRKFSPQGTSDVYNVFEWQGKKYAVDQFTGTNLYNFDMERNKLGTRIPKFHNGTGPGGVPAPYGKEMLAIVEGGERIFPKEYNAGFNGSSYQGSSYTIQNNINGSDMNTQELADMVTRRTLAAIKTIEYNQIRTSGQRRSF
jgi:hypothetical protein